ncbi:TPA: hypothetical protein ACX3E3_002706 [Vibrio parahaemolyticus]
MARSTSKKSLTTSTATSKEGFASKLSSIITENINKDELNLFVEHIAECLTRFGPEPKRHNVEKFVADILSQDNFNSCQYRVSDQYKLFNGELLKRSLNDADCFRNLTLEGFHKQKLTFSYPLARLTAKFLETEIKFLFIHEFSIATNEVSTKFFVLPFDLSNTTTLFDSDFKNELHRNILHSQSEEFSLYLFRNLNIRNDISIEEVFLKAKELIDRSTHKVLENAHKLAVVEKSKFNSKGLSIEKEEFLEYLSESYVPFEYKTIEVNKEYKSFAFKDEPTPIFEVISGLEGLLLTALDLENKLISFAHDNECYKKVGFKELSDLEPDLSSRRRFKKYKDIRNYTLYEEYVDKLEKVYFK